MEFCKRSGAPQGRKCSSFTSSRENPYIPSVFVAPPPVSCSLKQEATRCRRGLIGRTGSDDDSVSGPGTLSALEGGLGERGSSQTVPRGASPPSGHKWELQCSQPKKCQHSVGLSTHILHPIPPHPYPADAGPPFQSLACVKDTGHLDLRLYNLPGSWVELTGVLDFLCLCQTEPLPAQACSVRAAASRHTPLGIRTLIAKLSFSTLP